MSIKYGRSTTASGICQFSRPQCMDTYCEIPIYAALQVSTGKTLKRCMPTKKQLLMVNVAHLIATVSAITIVTLVNIFLFNNPYDTASMNHSTQWIMSGLVVLSLIAVGAAWKKRILVLTACFVLSFVPLGFYLLLTPGIFALIGVAHLGFLLSALLLATSRRR